MTLIIPANAPVLVDVGTAESALYMQDAHGLVLGSYVGQADGIRRYVVAVRDDAGVLRLALSATPSERGTLAALALVAPQPHPTVVSVLAQINRTLGELEADLTLQALPLNPWRVGRTPVSTAQRDAAIRHVLQAETTDPDVLALRGRIHTRHRELEERYADYLNGRDNSDAVAKAYEAQVDAIQVLETELLCLFTERHAALVS